MKKKAPTKKIIKKARPVRSKPRPDVGAAAPLVAERTSNGGKKSERDLEAVGRRKTSVARVRLYEGEKFSIFINQKPFENYFPTYELRHIVEEPLSKTNLTRDFSISVKVNGGGIHSQAEAVRHGISRMLEKREPGLRKILKPLGFLKRDPRMKERRKFGLKKARKAPQWAKR